MAKYYKLTNLYEITRKGIVRNRITKKILSIDNSRNYPAYKLSINGRKRTCFIHRLIGEKFIPNPYNYPLIGHLDEVKTNYMEDNLYWTNQADNMLHYWKNKKLRE